MSLDPLQPIKLVNPDRSVQVSGRAEHKSWNIKSVCKLLEDTKNQVVIIVFTEGGKPKTAVGLFEEVNMDGDSLKIKFSKMDPDWLKCVVNHIIGVTQGPATQIRFPYQVYKGLYSEMAKMTFNTWTWSKQKPTLPTEIILGTTNDILACHILTKQCVVSIPPERVPLTLFQHLQPSGSA